MPELFGHQIAYSRRQRCGPEWNSLALGQHVRPLSQSIVIEGFARDKRRPMFDIGPSDPIWDMVDETETTEKLPRRHRMLLIAVAGAIPWLSLVALAALRT